MEVVMMPVVLRKKEIRIKGIGAAWAEFVDIGCEYVHPDLQLEMRVTDKKGNENICWLNVVVEDKIAPHCEDLALSVKFCDEFHNGELGASTDTDGDRAFDEDEWLVLPEELQAVYDENFGTFNCYDNLNVENCGTLDHVEEYQLIEWPCGAIEISRRHKSIDWSENESEYAHQMIKINYRAGWTFTVPSDWEGQCGDQAIAPELIIENGACDLLGFEVTSKLFEVPGDACWKMERTYHIINWCKYEAGSDPIKLSRIEGLHDFAEGFTLTSEGHEEEGYWAYVQVLKVHDDEGPVVTVVDPEPCINGVDHDAAPYGIEDITPGAAPYECDELKTWTASATDCSDQSAITWEGKLFDANGNMVASSTTNSISYVVTNKASYYAEFWAYDGCGNSGGNSGALIKFWDCKKPSPYCIHGVVVELMPATQMIQVWATDLNRGSFDNCTSGDRLLHRIWHAALGDAPTDLEGVKGLPPTITFNCTYLGIQTVHYYVVDEEGNWDFCETYVNVQDNMSACSQIEPGDGMAFVTGTVNDWKDKVVENVMVQTSGTSLATNMEYMTGANGHYAFELAMNKDYTITPEKTDSYLTGVSTFDLVLLSKHILGIAPFTNPYQHIAADVNQSGTVTAFDMVQIRRLILAIDDVYPNNASWKFVDADFEFPTENPLQTEYPEYIEVTDLQHDMVMDFVAIKIGDVHGNAVSSGLVSTTSRNQEALELTTLDMDLKAGERYAVTLSAKEFDQILGYQFTLSFEGLKFETITNHLGEGENFGLTKIGEGLITTSWNQFLEEAKTEIAVNTNLFTLEFTALQAGKLSEQLAIIDTPTNIEAYDQEEVELDIKLNFNTLATDEDIVLYQNEPNPFHNQTNIQFYLSSDSPVNLTLNDETGKLLKEIKIDGKAGLQTINLNDENLPSGLIYYQLKSDFGVKTSKMIHIN